MGTLLGIGTIFTEYSIQVGIAAGIVGVLAGIFLITGSVVGILYLIFWAAEENGDVDENPIDLFIFVTLPQWIETIAMTDYIRIPLIWFEY